MKKCFALLPITKEDTEEREHIENVVEFIIEPAISEYDIRLTHSNMISSGLITDQIITAILTADLILTVLTFHNPYVYYELAIGQAANRPIIILLEKSEKLPFNKKNLLCVFYDLKPKSLFEKVYTKQIIDHIKYLESVNWKGSSFIPEFNFLNSEFK